MELTMLWAAHKAVGLEGYMCLYSPVEQIPFRSKQPGISFWFGPGDTAAACEQIISIYNQGHLPNTPLLLNPIVHKKNDDGAYTPLGSGVIWSSSLCLGIDVLKPESAERIWELGVHASNFHRGESDHVGLKIVGFCDAPQAPLPDGKSVTGCRELYELANINSDQYAPYLHAVSHFVPDQ